MPTRLTLICHAHSSLEWDLGDTQSVEVEDLLGGNRFTLYGKTHQIALDPYDRCAVIWRLVPPADWKGGR